MTGIFSGNLAVNKVYLGRTPIKKVYVGSVLVYEEAEPESFIPGNNILSSASRMCIILPNGEYAATDWGNHCVKIFNSDGTLKLSYGSSGNGSGKFQNPYGIVRDSDGYLYITDYRGQSSSYYLQKLSYDGQQISFVSQLQVPGGGAQISYSSGRDALILNAYGSGKIIQVPRDLSGYTQIRSSVSLSIGNSFTADGLTLYHSMYSSGIQKSVYNSVNDTTPVTNTTVVSGASGTTQGLALSDDESYLLYVDNTNKCIKKVDLSNNNVTTVVADMFAYSITNNGNNRFTWVGGSSDSTSICRLDL